MNKPKRKDRFSKKYEQEGLETSFLHKHRIDIFEGFVAIFLGFLVAGIVGGVLGLFIFPMAVGILFAAIKGLVWVGKKCMAWLDKKSFPQENEKPANIDPIAAPQAREHSYSIELGILTPVGTPKLPSEAKDDEDDDIYEEGKYTTGTENQGEDDDIEELYEKGKSTTGTENQGEQDEKNYRDAFNYKRPKNTSEFEGESEESHNTTTNQPKTN